jgi:hypothetical protein
MVVDQSDFVTMRIAGERTGRNDTGENGGA